MRPVAFLLALTLVSAAHAETISGRVVSITDGDTLTVLVAKRQGEAPRLSAVRFGLDGNLRR